MDPLDFKPMESESRRQILEFIRSRLKEADPRKLRRALLSLDWVERPGTLAAPLMELVRGGDEDLSLVALEGLSRLESIEAERELSGFLRELFEDESPGRESLREECVRVLGKVGSDGSIEMLAGVIRGRFPASTREDCLAAVEGLVSLGVRGRAGAAPVLERLYRESDDELKESILQALRELNVSDWDEKGFLTIEARYEQDEQER